MDDKHTNKPKKSAKPNKIDRIPIGFTQDIHRRRRTSKELVTVPPDDGPEAEEQAED